MGAGDRFGNVGSLPDRLPITIAGIQPFTCEARKLFTGEELESLRDHVTLFRELGAVTKDTGGLRKLRWCTDNNRGKKPRRPHHLLLWR